MKREPVEPTRLNVGTVAVTGARWFGTPIWRACEHTSDTDSTLVWRFYVYVGAERMFVTECALGGYVQAIKALDA